MIAYVALVSIFFFNIVLTYHVQLYFLALGIAVFKWFSSNSSSLLSTWYICAVLVFWGAQNFGIHTYVDVSYWYLFLL